MITKKIENEIARRNEIWKNASAQERRILVCKDVISRIKSGQFQPETGKFASLTIQDKEDKDSVQACVISKEPCECCALGGMLLSTISYKNRVTIKDWVNVSYGGHLESPNEFNYFGIAQVFTKAQLKKIEQAFEGFSGLYGPTSEVDFCCDEDEVKACNAPKEEKAIMSFYLKYTDPKARMIAIMNNIIRNNGLFLPS